MLVEGQKILKVAPSIEASDAAVINAKGRVVMPGFVDTHHHQFETALRSFLPNGIMFADPTRPGEPNYLDDILGKFSKVYRPEDVYIAELFGGLSQLDAGVTTVLDVVPDPPFARAFECRYRGHERCGPPWCLWLFRRLWPGSGLSAGMRAAFAMSISPPMTSS